MLKAFYVALLYLSLNANASQLPMIKWLNDDAEFLQVIETNKNLIKIDTRHTNEYNGWYNSPTTTQNTIKGRLNDSFNFDVDWLNMFNSTQINSYFIDKINLTLKTELKNLLDLTSDHTILLSSINVLAYDTSVKRLEKFYNYLIKTFVCTHLSLYVLKANSNGNLVKSFTTEVNYEYVVPPEYVYNLVFNNNQQQSYKIFEVSAYPASAYYVNGHIPSSVHLCTDNTIEDDDEIRKNQTELSKFLLSIGIKQNYQNEIIVLYGNPDPMAAYRAGAIMNWIGVKNVRILNGGYNEWLRKSFQVERTLNEPKPVLIQHHLLYDEKYIRANYIVDMDFVLNIVKNQEVYKQQYVIVDLRSWDEYIGKKSFSSVKGHIPHAVWGKGSAGSQMYYYRNPDLTMRSLTNIRSMWIDLGIDYKNKHLIFYCGGGWRAAEVLFYADVMGLKNISLYDGSWGEWIKYSTNPIETGVPEYMQKNEYFRKFQANATNFISKSNILIFLLAVLHGFLH